ncbi:MAG: DUF2809 domain-containing protein [Calditrichaeota bacterium]|nr:DUF2809 domain-containing protein [Calditrichota bacterium]
MTIKQFFLRRHLTWFSLILIIPIGFASKFYSGAAANWVNNSLGGFFYVIFWCLFFHLAVAGAKPLLIAAWVLGVTSLLEFTQLWHPPMLEWMRSFFLGRALIGTSFVWSDFFYYFLGAIVGWGWLHLLRKFEKPTEK